MQTIVIGEKCFYDVIFEKSAPQSRPSGEGDWANVRVLRYIPEGFRGGAGSITLYYIEIF